MLQTTSKVENSPSGCKMVAAPAKTKLSDRRFGKGPKLSLDLSATKWYNITDATVPDSGEDHCSREVEVKTPEFLVGTPRDMYAPHGHALSQYHDKAEVTTPCGQWG